MNGTIYSSILEAEEKIDFENLKFPIYRKTETENFKLLSVSKVVSVRNDATKAIGISEPIPKNAFIKIHSFYKESNENEFNEILNKVIELIK